MTTMATEPASAAGAQLATYLGTLRRRKWTIIVVTLLAVGAAIGLSKSETPAYESTASVLLQTSATQIDTALGITNTPYNIADEIERMQSPSVANRVRRQIGTAPPVAVSNPTSGGQQTHVLDITASSSSPQLAAKIANAYASAYIQQRQSDAITSYVGAGKVVQTQISNVQDQIKKASTQAVSTTVPSTGSQPVSTTVPSTGSQPVSSTVPPALESQLNLLQQELTTLQTEASVGASGAELIRPATVPSSATSPKTVRNAAIGLAGGLVLGIALAFLRESLDDTIVSREDLDRAQPGLPVLEVLPAMAGRDKDLVSTTRPHSPAAEAYRGLRTSVQFLGLDQPVKLLQVTSPRTAEGKTTVVANLALTFAAAGQRVIAVDCDLRRSRLHSLFGVSNKEGFTSVLIGQTPLSVGIQEVPGHENLSVLTAGARPPNPAELLSGARAGEVFSALKHLADIVIVDCPPVLPVTDAVLTATNMDATLMIVSSGTTTAKDVSNALEVLARVDAPVVGVVLNGVEINAGYRYRYRYSYEPRHTVPADRP
jgi:capsular exopolysaccharide synthesis family protein